MEMPQTRDFRIKISKDPNSLTGGYLIVNKLTGIAEHKDTHFSRAYNAMIVMQTELSIVLKTMMGSSTADSNVVSI